MKSAMLGNNIRRRASEPVSRSDLFYYVALNPEVALDIHAAHGVLIHVGLGGYLRLAENMSRLCQGASEQYGPEECRSEIGVSDTVLSKKGVDLHLRVGLGAHF